MIGTATFCKITLKKSTALAASILKIICWHEQPIQHFFGAPSHPRVQNYIVHKSKAMTKIYAIYGILRLKLQKEQYEKI